MASKKVYFNNIEGMSELEIYRNDNDCLFICLSPFPETHSSDCYIGLPPEDAKEIITELARDFGMLDEESVEGNILFKP